MWSVRAAGTLVANAIFRQRCGRQEAADGCEIGRQASGRCAQSQGAIQLPDRRDLRGRHRAHGHGGEIAARGKATIAESYADSRGGEIWLVNANIPEYLQAGRFNHAPKRVRKLLLHRRQINKLMGAVEREGMTLVPLKLYFNEKGRAKIELALARGKKLHDKRETEKKRSWERERGRLLRAKG